MQKRFELQNAILALEVALDRNEHHIANSRKKHLGAFSLAEASDGELVAFLAHLDGLRWAASVGEVATVQLELI